jgi:hypothetical protein
VHGGERPAAGVAQDDRRGRIGELVAVGLGDDPQHLTVGGVVALLDRDHGVRLQRDEADVGLDRDVLAVLARGADEARVGDRGHDDVRIVQRRPGLVDRRPDGEGVVELHRCRR